MNWLTEFVRPKIRTLFTRREVPDNLWHQCPACEQMIFHRDLMANLKVCPHCGHHMRAKAVERLEWTRRPNAQPLFARSHAMWLEFRLGRRNRRQSVRHRRGHGD